MPVRFQGRPDGWRPSWAQMLDIVQRFCQQQETAEEVEWLRAHPIDWLLVARYMRKRVENHMAESRAKLRELPVVDEATGRTLPSYLAAKRDMDQLNRKRLHWLSHVDEQIEEARYLMGTDPLTPHERHNVLSNLIEVRHGLMSKLWEPDEPLLIVEAMLRSLSHEQFDPDAYRPEGR